MFECQASKKEHTGQYGSGRFCNEKCSRSYSALINKEQKNAKISSSLKGRVVKKEAKCPRCNRYFEKMTSLASHSANCLANPRKIERENLKKNKIDDLLKTTTFENIPPSFRREKIFSEQAGCCNRCKLAEWLGEKITLELEHKDGDTQNNVRDNLELLCPNCHSLTHTWRGRNKNSGKTGKRVSDADLLLALKEELSIRAALIRVGLAPKGGNYFRAKRMLEDSAKQKLLG